VEVAQVSAGQIIGEPTQMLFMQSHPAGQSLPQSIESPQPFPILPQ
jgi:hypothetical protein